MTTNFKASGIELTEAIRLYAEEKVTSVENLLPDPNNVHADIELQKLTAHHQKGLVFRAEVNMRQNGQFYRAEAVEDDLYAAIDAVKDELSREIISSKTRKESLFRRGARVMKKLLRQN